MNMKQKFNIAKDVAQGKAELSSMLITIQESFDKIQEFCTDTQHNQSELMSKMCEIENKLNKLK